MASLKKDIHLFARLVKRYVLKLSPVFLVVLLGASLYGSTNTLSIGLANTLLNYMSGTREYTIPYINMTFEGVQLLNAVIILLFIANLMRFLGSFLGTISSDYISAKISRNLRDDIYKHYLYMTSKDYDRTSSGYLLSLMNYNATTLSNALGQTTYLFFREGITLIFLVIFLFYKNFQLATIVFCLVPVIGLVMFISGSKFRNLGSKMQTNIGALSALTADVLKSQKIVKMYGSQESELRKFKFGSNQIMVNMLRVALIKSLSYPSIQFLVGGIVGLFLWFIIKNEVFKNVNELLIFAGTLTLMAHPIRILSEIQNPLNAGFAAAEGIFEFLDSKTEIDIPASRCLLRIQGNIEFKNVSFKYEPGGNQILKNVSFSVAPNETIAIVGSSGSGKSTLMSLLMRLYDFDEGSITIDGVDIRELDLQNWRSFISVVSQQNLLFNDSVVYNICYGAKVNNADLEQAIQNSYSNFIYSLKDGLYSRVGDSATLLSGGQAQRIALARAFYKNSPILVLDEATSSLDADSEAKIQKAIDKLKYNKTTFIIAHRLSTVKLADKIIALQNGEIAEIGTHNSLINKENGVYKSLYNTQLISNKPDLEPDSNGQNGKKLLPSPEDKGKIPWYKKLWKPSIKS